MHQNIIDTQMAKYNYISICLLLVSLCCSSQNNTSGKALPVRTLDLKKYKNHWTDDKAVIVINNIDYSLEEQDAFYLEREQELGSRFIKYASFDKHTLTVLYEGEVFSEMQLGIHKVYNLSGEVVKIRDFEEGFPFTADALITKVRDDLSLDLNDTKYTVQRYKDEQGAAYFIRYMLSDVASQFIRISAETGEIIFNKMIFLEE